MATVELTGSRARDLASRIRTVFERYHIHVDGSPISENLAELDWLGTSTGDVLGKGGLYERFKDRATSALVTALRLTQIIDAIEYCDGLDGFRSRLSHLRNLQTGLPAPHGSDWRGQAYRQAWDLLYEIEVAGLLRASGIDVHFGEPDLVISLESGVSVGLACKRPQHPEGVHTAVAQAESQILKFHPAGLVLLNADVLLAGANALAAFVVVEDRKEIDPECERRLGVVSVSCAEWIAKGLGVAQPDSPAPPGALAVLLVANFVTFSPHSIKGKQIMECRIRTSAVVGLDKEGGLGPHALAAQLEIGQRVFRANQK